MIEAIVLAAGLGTRMGRVKPLVPIDGTPALEVIVRRLCRVGIAHPIVVLGRSARRVQETVDLKKARVVVNDRPEMGMARSLALGVGAVSAEARGALVALADMPYVAERTTRAVLDAAAAGAQIAAPVYHGQRGFPVYFRRDGFEALLQGASGDTGGRTLIELHPEWLTLLAVDDPGCLRDLDSPIDLAAEEEAAFAVRADHD